MCYGHLAVIRMISVAPNKAIFAPYGRVENVCVIRNEHKQSRGCAFVSYLEKEMAFAAISALDGVYRMAGCPPLIVRFADSKRPRSGEGRMRNMGSNYSPRSHQSGPRGTGGQTMRAQNPAFGWRQGGGPSNVGLLPQSGQLPLGARGPVHSQGGPLEGPNPTMVNVEKYIVFGDPRVLMGGRGML
ncbi:hypothetical protein GOP47_0020187 [Adiantum capillus-veneris]|uniref:RRM domain-containing protein n=1 Tax=Adiantum capillus-veneris TaxID=13818 RepID=A0A9D4UD02_ADICA|nr:hypothetical protein GOP47_0020187 [Adiantum capillus-veneris]